MRGAPDDQRTDVPWASLDSEVNTTGFMMAPGYAFDVVADGYVGMSYSVLTYAGLKEMLDRDPVALRRTLTDALPKPVLEVDPLTGLTPFEVLMAHLENHIATAEEILDECDPLYIPFRFNVMAAATPMTRAEFVARQTAEALQLRGAILADLTANAVLVNLAADEATWVASYLAALEDSGLLRPENEAPPIRLDPKVVSRLGVLASGVLVGAGGEQFITNSSLLAFFGKLHEWYGDEPGKMAIIDHYDVRESEDCPPYPIPVPALPLFEDYDLGLSHGTYFQAFNVFSPWMGLPATGALPEFASVTASNELSALTFSDLLQQAIAGAQSAGITGPQGFGENQFVPAAESLPYTISFENAADSSTWANEIRVLTQLDDGLNARSFRLGGIRIGDISVSIPTDRAGFQGDFDLRNSKGFILRVSAGIDTATSIATWLLQAIDPLTGEVLADKTRGLLGPNNAQGRGAASVSYSAASAFGAQTGNELRARATVFFDTAAPVETDEIVHVLDAKAPVTTLTAALVAQGAADYEVRWQSDDDPFGSGVQHATVYVSEDGEDWKIWLRQTTETFGVYEGRAGHTYEFLALSTDNAGNRERPPAGTTAPDDGSRANLGTLFQAGATTQDIGEAPAPGNQASTNPLFAEAEQGIPAPDPLIASEFTDTLKPFTTTAFGTGIPQSHAEIGPLAAGASRRQCDREWRLQSRTALSLRPGRRRGGQPVRIAGRADLRSRFGQDRSPLGEHRRGPAGRARSGHRSDHRPSRREYYAGDRSRSGNREALRLVGRRRRDLRSPDEHLHALQRSACR